MFTKEEIRKLLAKKGTTRGVVFQTDADYIKSKEGEDGIKKVEAKLKKWNIDLVYNEINPMEWYPVAWRLLSIAAAKTALNWEDKDIRAMGNNAPKVSIVVKLFFKLFPSIIKFAEQVPHYWRKHYTVGELEVIKVDEERREMILHLKDFIIHPVLCKYFEGYFARTTKLTRPADSKVICRELKCSFNDDVDYQEFQITWTT